jgi:RNAse (barnase) inhibitor barstar
MVNLNSRDQIADMLASRDSEGDSRIILLSAGIKGRHELFQELSKGLNFPDYFGNNWDALDECINDLSWLSETSIYVIHNGFPALDEQEIMNYWDTIKTAVENWKAKSHKKFAVIFE